MRAAGLSFLLASVGVVGLLASVRIAAAAENVPQLLDDWNESPKPFHKPQSLHYEWTEEAAPTLPSIDELMETRVASDHAAKQPTCDERAGTGDMPFSGCVTLQRMTNTIEEAIQETISTISVGDPDVDKYVKVSGLV